MRIQNYLEYCINYNGQEFRQHFRLSRDAFDFVLGLVTLNIDESQKPFEIPVEKQLLAVIWLLANQESYR